MIFSNKWMTVIGVISDSNYDILYYSKYSGRDARIYDGILSVEKMFILVN